MLKKSTLSSSVFLPVVLFAASAFASESTNPAAAGSSPSATWLALAASLSIGAGVIGGTMAQGRAASTALEGIARNPGAAPRIQTPMILGLALIESLVLLSFVIAFFLQSKI